MLEHKQLKSIVHKSILYAIDDEGYDKTMFIHPVSQFGGLYFLRLYTFQLFTFVCFVCVNVLFLLIFVFILSQNIRNPNIFISELLFFSRPSCRRNGWNFEQRYRRLCFSMAVLVIEFTASVLSTLRKEYIKTRSDKIR